MKKQYFNQVTISADERLPTIDFEKLEPLQGALKSLSDKNFERLKKSILERGFFVPVFIWNNGKKPRLIDGHQRIRVLQSLKDQGYTIPKIPYVAIKARTEKEAKEKILAISSAFGKIERQGLYEFLEGLDKTLLVTDFALPEFELDTDKFLEEFFLDRDEKEEEKKGEVSSTRPETFNVECPKCGHSFEAKRVEGE